MLTSFVRLVIKVALEMNNYQFVRNYVAKAESALEVLTSSAAPVKQAASSNMPGMVAPAANAYESAKDKERVVTAERLTVAGGIAFLGSGEYSKAAKAFTSVGRETFMGPIPHVRSLLLSLASRATCGMNDLTDDY